MAKEAENAVTRERGRTRLPSKTKNVVLVVVDVNIGLKLLPLSRRACWTFQTFFIAALGQKVHKFVARANERAKKTVQAVQIKGQKAERKLNQSIFFDLDPFPTSTPHTPGKKIIINNNNEQRRGRRRQPLARPLQAVPGARRPRARGRIDLEGALRVSRGFLVFFPPFFFPSFLFFFSSPRPAPLQKKKKNPKKKVSTTSSSTRFFWRPRRPTGPS